MNEQIDLTGKVTATLYDSDGNVKQKLEADNLIVDAGKSWLMSRIGSNSQATASLVAIGTSNTAAVAGDTGLGSLLYSKNGIVSNVLTTHRVTAQFNPGEGSGVVVEYGLYASGSALVGRLVSGSLDKGAGDTLQVVYDLIL